MLCARMRSTQGRQPPSAKLLSKRYLYLQVDLPPTDWRIDENKAALSKTQGQATFRSGPSESRAYHPQLKIMSDSSHWDALLSGVKARMSQESFHTWFRPITFLGEEENRIRLGIPDLVFKDWIMTTYKDLLDEVGVETNLKDCEFVFEVVSDTNTGFNSQEADAKEDAGVETRTSAESSSFRSSRSSGAAVAARAATASSDSDADPMRTLAPEKAFIDLPLNKRYTFDSFVVGSCNQFAHAAAVAVADSLGRAYNPLYIYGGVGLGKTHLMCAIGQRVREQNRHARLSYISAETFMNELINAIRYEKTINFREMYRSIDVLLIDDIQFLAGKERTQEEFFHTFNALYDGEKQIVISSDCPPREIPTLEERLHSRFEWGLIADIQPPDLETKVAILRRKAETEQIDLPDNVALFIASKIKSNIRELEGSLVRLMALSSLHGEQINLSLAQEAIKNIIEDEERSITIELIQKVVAEFYNLRVADLKSKSNTRAIAVPRQIAMHLCKTLTKASLPEIGRAFGGKHHTTVLHSINKINALYEQKGDIHRVVNSLIANCK
jgi:chromosomal replication initiator protein